MDPSVVDSNGLRNTLGLSWMLSSPDGANNRPQSFYTDSQASSRLRESVCNIDADDELMSSPPPPPNVWLCTLPLLGRIQVVKDIAGYIQSSIIVLYWVYGNWSTWLAILLPHYYDGQLPFTMLVLYSVVSALCIVSFIRASTLNPGSLSNTYQPQPDWTICGKCCRRRPPLTHHCRRCGQCVRKMDHHCPWINNCVGEDNQYAFLMLLGYAYTLSLVTLILDIMHWYYIPHCVTCDRDSFMMRHENGIIWTAVVMAVMMISGAAGLYLSQHISILFEVPSMELMRIQQTYLTSGLASIQWPQQTRSAFTAYRATCGDGPWIFWPFPCRKRQAPAFSRPQFHI
jgi:palmitoyltransferase